MQAVAGEQGTLAAAPPAQYVPTAHCCTVPLEQYQPGGAGQGDGVIEGVRLNDDVIEGVRLGDGVMEGVQLRDGVVEGVRLLDGVRVGLGVTLQLGAALSPVAAQAEGQGQARGCVPPGQ